MMLRVCVVAAVMAASGSDAGAVRRPWHSRSPRVENASFELSLRGLRRSAARRARIHQAGDQELIVFLPGARTPRRFRKFASGPIASLKARKVRRGAVVVLKTRDPYPDLKSRLEITSGKSASLRFDGVTKTVLGVGTPKHSSSLTATPTAGKAPQLEKADPVKKRRTPVTAAPGQMPAKKGTVKDPASPAKKRGDDAITAGSEPQAAFPWARSRRRENVTEQSVMRVAPHYSSVATSSMLGLLLFGGLAGLWAMKKKTAFKGDMKGIEVVAVQGLLGKHKLALVETCGERLLIAASDKEVRLLSHVGSDLVNPASLGTMIPGQWSGSPALTEEEPERSPEAPVVRPAPPRGTVGGNVGYTRGTFSRDLDGLMKLRDQAVEKPASSSVLGHLTERYTNSGAAA